jgi:hypothetical protein
MEESNAGTEPSKVGDAVPHLHRGGIQQTGLPVWKGPDNCTNRLTPFACAHGMPKVLIGTAEARAGWNWEASAIFLFLGVVDVTEELPTFSSSSATKKTFLPDFDPHRSLREIEKSCDSDRGWIVLEGKLRSVVVLNVREIGISSRDKIFSSLLIWNPASILVMKTVSLLKTNSGAIQHHRSATMCLAAPTTIYRLSCFKCETFPNAKRKSVQIRAPFTWLFQMNIDQPLLESGSCLPFRELRDLARDPFPGWLRLQLIDVNAFSHAWTEEFLVPPTVTSVEGNPEALHIHDMRLPMRQPLLILPLPRKSELQRHLNS